MGNVSFSFSWRFDWTGIQSWNSLIVPVFFSEFFSKQVWMSLYVKVLIKHSSFQLNNNQSKLIRCQLVCYTHNWSKNSLSFQLMLTRCCCFYTKKVSQVPASTVDKIWFEENTSWCSVDDYSVRIKKKIQKESEKNLKDSVLWWVRRSRRKKGRFATRSENIWRKFHRWNTITKKMLGSIVGINLMGKEWNYSHLMRWKHIR